MSGKMRLLSVASEPAVPSRMESPWSNARNLPCSQSDGSLDRCGIHQGIAGLFDPLRAALPGRFGEERKIGYPACRRAGVYDAVDAAADADNVKLDRFVFPEP